MLTMFNKHFTSHYATDWPYDRARVTSSIIAGVKSDIRVCLACILAWRLHDIGDASVHKQPAHLEKTHISSCA